MSLNESARLELNDAWKAALAAIARAEKHGKREIGIQWTEEKPYYRLLAVDDSFRMKKACWRFDGFTKEQWAGNLLYAMEETCCFFHASRDDIDVFLDKGDER